MPRRIIFITLSSLLGDERHLNILVERNVVSLLETSTFLSSLACWIVGLLDKFWLRLVAWGKREGGKAAVGHLYFFQLFDRLCWFRVCSYWCSELVRPQMFFLLFLWIWQILYTRVLRYFCRFQWTLEIAKFCEISPKCCITSGNTSDLRRSWSFNLFKAFPPDRIFRKLTWVF